MKTLPELADQVLEAALKAKCYSDFHPHGQEMYNQINAEVHACYDRLRNAITYFERLDPRIKQDVIK